jgi:hypothetical protein
LGYRPDPDQARATHLVRQPAGPGSETEEEHRKLAEEGEALLFSHTLETLIGGQLDAGLTLCGFYEDRYGNEDLLSRHMPTFIATRAVKAR